ncbi:LCP family protein [Metabacillus litoralis]|jgi:polyisoprenyl-teichoic acid--peptidoglycan teichoic acid transferase|uniref:LCP family protein n=1 Tax=Metabacillus litoralis TaxID=152268 RepID=UPI00204162A1|nr:LCP family protein [Metabacillus litoralis]MCM3653586.1 LCP family protein [Metabacillus litoralis]
MNRKEMKRVKKKKKRPILRRLLFLALLLFLCVGGYIGYVFYQTFAAANESYDDLGREKSRLRDYAVSISNDPVSILLLGVENYSSGGKGGRSDTLMVATFNPTDQTMKLLSIPRDTRVEIPGKGLNKINHSFSKGGKELTIETVEDFLNIPIDYYATVNFDGLKNIVDIVGGVTVDVPFDFTQNSDDPKAEKLEFFEGPMKLDGRYALAYARMRLQDPNNDIGRNERQQEVVKAIIDEIASAGTLLKVDKLTNEVGKNVETNMRVSELLGFYQKYSGFSTKSIETIKLDGVGEYISGTAYWIPEEESVKKVQKELQSHLEIPVNSATNKTESTDVVEKNAATK